MASNSSRSRGRAAVRSIPFPPSASCSSVKAEPAREPGEAERPRQRLLDHCAAALSTAEILSLVASDAENGDPEALHDAHRLLAERDLTELAASTLPHLLYHGLAEGTAIRLLASFELARRLAQATLPLRLPMDKPAAIVRFLALQYWMPGQEVFGVLFLTTRHHLIARELFRGTMSRAAVEPGPVFREALLRGAAALIAFHTHPSGCPTPSREDLLWTQRLREAGELMGIEVLDHLILGSPTTFYSFKATGFLLI
ncbi:MAG: DNA repair protein RadC [Acidobacteriota bacterium]|nr:DNA repair protein RadC [Acidobacteriota bacterium]